ncbi:MAG: hypothetical protein R3E64_05620 [Halioglobus sp.]
MSHWITRLLLVAALVLSQALFAGHSLAHANGDQPHCQICLQASSSGAALTSAEFGPLLTPCTAEPAFTQCTPVTLLVISTDHPARAPPSIPV